MECKFCRGEIPEGAKVCPTCGTPVEPEEEQTQEMNKEQRTENQYQYGIPDANQQSQYQYGTFDANQQSQYQYGASDANQQSQYQYGAPNQGNYGEPQKQISGTPYMIFAIIITLLCCLPFGIAAIVYASKINAHQKMGDYTGAQEAAKKAKLFCIIGAVGGLIVSVIYIALIGSSVFTEIASDKDNRTSSVVREQEDDIEDEDEDEDEDVDVKVPVKPVEQSSELGATWDTYTVQINDKVLTFPCSFEDVEAAGLILDEDYTPESYMINADEYELAWFEDANGNELMFEVFNATDEAKTMKECMVIGIVVDDYGLEEGGLTVIFPGGIQIGSTKDEVMGKYGEPDDIYEEDEEIHMYTWYVDDDSYDNYKYKSCNVYIDAETGIVNHMDIQNYGQ